MSVAPIRKDLTGKVFGHLQVIKETDLRDSGGFRIVECLCDCGNTVNVRKINLGSGNTKSCNSNAHRKGNNATHGLTKHRLYWILAGMKRRCYYEKDKSYKDYGAKGVKVCDEWKNSTVAFYEWGIQNGWAEGLEIDRKEVTGDYEPGNCRFVTKLVNMQNTRRSRKFIFNGEEHSLTELATITNIPYGTLWDRICKEKMPVEMAIERD